LSALAVVEKFGEKKVGFGDDLGFWWREKDERS